MTDFRRLLLLSCIGLFSSACAVHQPGRTYDMQHGYSERGGVAAEKYQISPRLPPAEKKVAQNLKQQYSKWAGTPYHYGGNSPRGIDCSAFMMQVFDDAFDRPLPRTTAQQVQVGKVVSRRSLRAGDLVFFRTGRNQRHVGVFMGQDSFLHASVTKGVTLSRLDDPYWRTRYWQSRRIL